MNTFSDRLREARVLRGYTQQSLARVAGLSQSAIASYESGRRQSSRAMRQLARVLRVRLDWLETGQGPRDASPSFLLQDATSYCIEEAQLQILQPHERSILEQLIRTYITACIDHAHRAAASKKKPADEAGR
ncbi:helix-turn-helix domain-containing protein [Bordetella avium]|uniref:helix-turn-helix domain-containing protein n=1 Tax=Bordetella avium TaxID=521 RepID=UPI0009DEC341|nr:helix-turn-helix transcriptional regulator [Bordetella avium]AZY47922.1 XRE family transcriptional regulator [Bordetella avium]AZY51293.1 XRE family transcriptional regulator [Bordetella avium]RIQ14851.1 XRE family transcriptional regulator [Bordetella avium]RIQ18657.1 XRE family transcriptional regulator [Bordetella avium]RIQ35307.1 XRE family transcriptional regulator [Bordetella avium]